jgi:glycerate kinase
MGAATVFGPQKGADPDTVRVLEQRLTDWAAALNAAAGQAVGDEPGAGAAGGIGAALLALGGRRESGAAVIAAVFSITDHAGSVQLAVEDAANQLEGLAEVTAATWG